MWIRQHCSTSIQVYATGLNETCNVYLTSVFTAGIVINIASYVSLQTPLCTYIEDAEIEPIGLVQCFFLLKCTVAPSIRMSSAKLLAKVQAETFIYKFAI